MIIDRYAPLDMFTLVPKLQLGFEPQLQELDRLLEDDVIVQRVKTAMGRRRRKSLMAGRHSTPVEVVVRVLVVKRLYGWSYAEVEQFVADSLVLRQFCRIYLQPVPDDTTLIRWANLLGPETVEVLNERVVALARSFKVTRGRKLRVDSTVVETNVHHPTDSRLLADGVRVLSRWLRRAKAVLSPATGLGVEVFRPHTRSVRRVVQQIHRVARRKGEAAAEELKGQYTKLLQVAAATRQQAERVLAALPAGASHTVRQVREQLGHLLPSVQQTIDQARRRVLAGQAVPAKEKLLSLFEPHTQVIQRHKPGKPVEFGRKVWLDEVDGGIVSGYRILTEAGPDHPYFAESLAKHTERFAHPPWLVAGDRGVYTAANELLAEREGVRRVVLPVAGKVSPKRRAREAASWFRRGFRFRAGIEGRISVLRRRFGLGRCLEHGADGMGRWVGWGVVTHNLAKITQTLADRRAA